MRVIATAPILFIFLLCSKTLLAGGMGMNTNTYPYNGFYVGGNLGVANLMDKESTDAPIVDKHQLSSTGILGGGLIGYDFTLRENYKLGLEGFVNATGLNVSATQNYAPIARYTARMQSNAGVRLLPGYAFSSNTVGHVILGYSYGQFKLSDSGDFGLIHSKFSKSGFQPGIGLQTALTQHLFIRGDVIYATYASQNSLGITTTSTPQHYRNTFATLEGDLALVYKFA